MGTGLRGPDDYRPSHSELLSDLQYDLSVLLQDRRLRQGQHLCRTCQLPEGSDISETWQSLWNTIKYAIIEVPFGIAIALVLAVLLNKKIAGRSIYRTIFFLPMVCAPAAVAMVWKWLYNTAVRSSEQYFPHQDRLDLRSEDRLDLHRCDRRLVHHRLQHGALHRRSAGNPGRLL